MSFIGLHVWFVERWRSCLTRERKGLKKVSGPRTRIDKETMTLTTRLLKHLDDAAIEAVLHLCGESATEGDNPSTRLADDALVHLAECSECDQRLRMHRDAHNRLEGLRLAQQDATAGICSETVDWTSVAADLLP